MKTIKKMIFAVLIMSTVFSLTVLAARKEGMGITTVASNEQVWKYYTGNDTENGTPEYLKNQWKQVWDNWYYFGDDGDSKQNTWAEIDGKWYYFDEWSRMLHDTTTPDGYYVGSDGAWVQNP